jgi:hypothetical protein
VAIAITLLLGANGRAQESVTGVVQNATTKVNWVRPDAESGVMVPVTTSQLILKTENGVRRYSIGRNSSVSTPDGGRKLKVGDFVEVFFLNGQVSEVKVRKLVGTVRSIDTRTDIATETLDGRAVGHREATYLTLKGRAGLWEVTADATITSVDGSPGETAHAGDEVELTFTDEGGGARTGKGVAGSSVWEVSEIKILKARGTETARQHKLVGVVARMETNDEAEAVRRDRVPNTRRRTETALQSQDVTFITLKDKGRWQASSRVRIVTPDGNTADAVHVGDEVELVMRAREIEQIKILKPATGGPDHRWSTKTTGVIERTDTAAVPVEMHDGEVLKTREVTKITMRDTGETWELSGDVKIRLPGGAVADTVHESDEVELTLRGKLVTEVKILKR